MALGQLWDWTWVLNHKQPRLWLVNSFFFSSGLYPIILKSREVGWRAKRAFRPKFLCGVDIEGVVSAPAGWFNMYSAAWTTVWYNRDKFNLRFRADRTGLYRLSWRAEQQHHRLFRVTPARLEQEPLLCYTLTPSFPKQHFHALEMNESKERVFTLGKLSGFSELAAVRLEGACRKAQSWTEMYRAEAPEFYILWRKIVLFQVAVIMCWI